MIHCVPKGAIDVVNATVLLADLTLSVCAAGSAPPSCQTNDNDAGVGVKVGTTCAAAIEEAKMKQKMRGLTIRSSTTIPKPSCRAGERVDAGNCA